ncbi:MAG: hypothetical protein AABX08_02900 [Nanoarchaeota archaeon]
MINIEGLIEINKQFSNGKIVNKGSLEFAISQSKSTKDWIKQLSFVTRAILIDHAFEEGNKRTVAALIASLIEIHKLAYDPKKIDLSIIEILKKNISNIVKIRRIIKDAIR